MRMSRRTCLHWVACGPLSLPFWGCGRGPSTAPVPTPLAAPVTKDMQLTYRATAEFASALGKALEAGQPVSVIFDGTERLKEGAPLLQFLSDPQRIQNHEAFWQSLDVLDTADGRRVLAEAFDESLLEHRAVTQIDGQHTRANGQVVGPGVVLMVLIISLIGSFTIVATTQIVVHGPIIAEWGVDPLSRRATMRMWPAGVP